MTESIGSTAVTETPEAITRLNRYTAWERVVTFSIVSGDTTGAATVPINGILQKIIIEISDFTTGDGSVDVSLTDNGDNTIFSVSNLADPATYTYNVSEPLVNEVNVILGFTDPTANETVTVTLRGI